MRLNNKTVVITGAGKGIGKAIAIALGREGANIVVNYHQDRLAAEQTCSELSKTGCKALAIQADIRLRKNVESLLEKTLSSYGCIDILVNNASITTRAMLNDIKDSDWGAIIDTNLTGTFLCSQIFGARLLEQRSGSIINISSTAAIHPLPRSHHYVSSKAGVIGLTKALALTMAPHVNVNAIAPGFVETEARASISEEQKKRILRQVPLGRFATTHEIANTVKFLVLDGAYITGQTIIIDGGFCINTFNPEDA